METRTTRPQSLPSLPLPDRHCSSWGTQQNLTPTHADRQPDWPDMGLSTSGDASKSTALPEFKVKIYGTSPGHPYI